MVTVKLATALLLTLVASSSAQEHQHGAGEKLGTVHFSTSCNAAAQKEFDRAVALLHSFEFSRAIAGFNVVLSEDATCGIAYALEHFEAPLKTEPGRFRTLYGAAHAAQLSGNRSASQRYFRELLRVCARADKPGRPE